MFAKLFQKSPQSSQPQDNVRQGSLTSKDLEPCIAVHYGIPSTASVMAYDPFQHLLAIGTLDGRIKVIGGDNIEGLLISPKPLPFKNLEFLQNQGFLVSVSNENELQVWDLENRRLSSNLQWESNITAFSVVYGTHYMYIGDEYGYLSVLKYDAEEGQIVQLPYHIPANVIAEAAEISLGDYQSVVGLLPQPCSFNRVLIAYENGLIVLWDVSEDKAALVRGSKDLELKDKCLAKSPNDVSHEDLDDSSDCEQAEKEISSLCWASSDGSVLAVGYVDGDILLWNLSVSDSGKDQIAKRSSDDVVKLQLSSGDRRLPVIVLHWSPSNTQKGGGGQLFIYGGEQIGSEEVLTILNLDWSSGIAKLKCIDRMDLPLNGSFADMIVMPNTSEADRNDTTSLFVLTNPGQLHFYDPACLSLFKTERAQKHSVQAFQYPAIIPTVEPYMTVGKLLSLGAKGNSLRAFLKTVSAAKSQAAQNMNKGSLQWPLTGGVPAEPSLDEDKEIERIYVAGYQDGSVRIWDATSPVLSLLTVLGVEVESTEIAGATATISALDFSSNLILAVGNERGLVCLYKLDECSDTTLYVLTETKHEVNNLQSERGSQCAAIFSLLTSPVCSLKYSLSGDKLAVGFGCGQVAMLDISSLSVLFLAESVSGSPVISLSMKTCPDAHDRGSDPSENETSNESAEISFVLTKDAHLIMMDSTTGNIICSQLMHQKGESTAISLYVIEGKSSAIEGSKEHLSVSSEDFEARNQPDNANHQLQRDLVEVKNPMKPIDLGQRFLDSLILLCCEDTLYLFPLKSVIQGESNSIHKVNLGNPCSWTTVFKKDAKECGLIIVYQSGVIEVRSLPDLEVVGQATLMSILRWSFKTNMDKTLSSSDKGLITLESSAFNRMSFLPERFQPNEARVYGCEFAFVSLLAFENDLRIPQALPCLHDKVLAAAADSAVSFFKNQKKDQSSSSGAFTGIIKGLKGVKAEQDVDFTEARENFIANLESMFSRFPFSDISLNIADDQEGVELNIDDIEIDEPVAVTSSSSNIDRIEILPANTAPEKETERERLFEGGSTDTKPRMRTREEIIAKYRNTGDATSAASQAKDKLLERQEKLEKLKRNTEELQSGAENFADLAKELAKAMEKRKWWHI